MQELPVFKNVQRNSEQKKCLQSSYHLLFGRVTISISTFHSSVLDTLYKPIGDMPFQTKIAQHGLSLIYCWVLYMVKILGFQNLVYCDELLFERGNYLMV